MIVFFSTVVAATSVTELSKLWDEEFGYFTLVVTKPIMPTAPLTVLKSDKNDGLGRMRRACS